MGSRLESNSDAVRKRIASHTFEDEDGEEYQGSKFGGFNDYFRRKKIKLQNLDADLRSHSSNKPQIFKGVVAHVNGYTQPSLNDLHTLIVQHGGGFMQYLDGKTTVTHIIASSLTPKKVVEFKRYRIVKPAWIVDSIKAGKVLPWNSYRVVDEGETQKVLAFDNGKVLSQANNRTRGYRDQTDGSWYTDQLKSSQAGGPQGTPSSTLRSRFTRQRLPTPNDGIDEIDDLPPSHQPESNVIAGTRGPPAQRPTSETKDLVTPPKTSPPPGLEQTSKAPEKGWLPIETKQSLIEQDDSLLTASTSPVSRHASLSRSHELAQESEIRDSVETLPNRQLTAEEHNAILLRDPKLRKSTVVDPNFLEQYYRESRLHHLSTWKADLKSQLQALANERSSSQKSKQKRPPGSRRYILHVDFDSFFAAVSLKKHPQWIDKPAVVAHGNGSGSEIASCNYPARSFGVKNGMWMKRAQELCPDLKILPYEFPAYEEASRSFYDAILTTGGLVQSVSIDEALIDVSAICIAVGGSDGRQMNEGSIYREQARADEIANFLREQVKKQTGCNVSVGIGGNVLLAKVALRRAKPAGQYQIKPEEVLDFLGQLQVQDLPGVAWSIGGKLEEIGIKYVKDIREFSKERLIQTLGPKTGEKLWEYSRGIDRTEVGDQVVRKSVSAEVNWGVRFENQEQADEFISSLCGELQKRLLKEKMKGKQFTMKIMRRSADAPLDPPKHLGHGKCDTFNKSLVLGVATNSKEILTKEALSILKGFGFSPGELRGIGIQMTKLEPMKSATDGSLESSQRRLQFKVGNAATLNKRNPSKSADPIQPADADTDPIQDDPETPRRPKPAVGEEHIAFGARELNHLTPTRRPLNTFGTQFILPTQADPKVLAELPEDIRMKLLKQARQSSPTPAPRKLPNVASDDEEGTNHNLYKGPRIPLTALPAPSQLDPEILAALPPEVRAEVMSQYAAGATPSSPRHRRADQTVLPQSPRKDRIIMAVGPPKRPAPPAKRGRGRPPRSAMLAAAAMATSKSKEGKTLTQANFVNWKKEEQRSRQGSHELAADSNSEAEVERRPPVQFGAEELDPDFLAALPEDMRKEIVEEHKRKKLQASRLAVFRKQKAHPIAQTPRRPPTVLVPRPKIPTFTLQRLSEASDLRAAIKEWFQEFSEDGPYPEDVGALIVYLGRVVSEERDLAKAMGVAKWMAWILEDATADNTTEVHSESWRGAIERVKRGIQDAVRERGLGAVVF